MLISDHAREWIAYIEATFPLADLFPLRCYSFESGYTKRTPQGFQYVLKRSGAHPDITLLVDDNAKNLAVAQSHPVNIRYTHRFTDAETLIEVLPSYGINL